MFAPLKRIMILAAALMVPGVAFSYVSIEDFDIDNWVPAGSAGFVTAIQAEVSSGDNWGSTNFYFQSDYTSICLDHDDFGPGSHTQIFYVPFVNNETAVTDGTGVSFNTYADDSCGGGSNNYNSADFPLIVVANDGWPDVIQFAVNKVFRPASDMDIQVNINCSAGSPGDDSAIMDDEGLHIFPQEFLNPSNPNHNCVITEDAVPEGYQALYVTNPNGFGGGAGYGVLHSTEGCFFYGSGNMRDLNTCQIINAGLPATFTITKFWEVYQDADASFVELDELRVRLTAVCSRVIRSAHISDQDLCLDDDADSSYNGCDFDAGGFFDPNVGTFIVTGDAVMTLTVDNTGLDPVECFADEDVFYSNVERTFTDCSTFENGKTIFEIGPGGSAGCTYVNTVFFEGIPTLSQYGMAIMALLMLGVGFVGFRRFV